MFSPGQDRNMNSRGTHNTLRGRGGTQRDQQRDQQRASMQFPSQVEYPDNNFGNMGGGNFNRIKRPSGPGPAPRFIIDSDQPNTGMSQERIMDFDMRSTLQMDRRSHTPPAPTKRDFLNTSNRNMGSRFSPNQIDANIDGSREGNRESLWASKDHKPHGITAYPVRIPPPVPRFFVESSKNTSDKSGDNNLEYNFPSNSKGRSGNIILDEDTFTSSRPAKQNFQAKRQDLDFRNQDVHLSLMNDFHDNDERNFSAVLQKRNENFKDNHGLTSMSNYSAEVSRGRSFSDRSSQNAADRGQRVREEDWRNKNDASNSAGSSGLQRKKNISIEQCFFDDSGEEISEQIIPGSDIRRGKLFQSHTSGPVKLPDNNNRWADNARKVGFLVKNDNISDRHILSASKFSSHSNQGNNANLSRTAELHKDSVRSNIKDIQRFSSSGRHISPVGKPNNQGRRRSISPSDNNHNSMRFKKRNDNISDDVPIDAPAPPIIGNISVRPESSSRPSSKNLTQQNPENTHRVKRINDIELLRKLDRNRSRSRTRSPYRSRSRSPIRSSRRSDFLMESFKNNKHVSSRDLSPDLSKKRRHIPSRRFSVDSIRPSSPVRVVSPGLSAQGDNNFDDRYSGGNSFPVIENVQNSNSFNMAHNFPTTTYAPAPIYENFNNINDYNVNLSYSAGQPGYNADTYPEYNSFNACIPNMPQGNQNQNYFGNSKRPVFYSKGYTNVDRERVMGEMNTTKQFMNPNTSNIGNIPGNPSEVLQNPVPVTVNNTSRNVSFQNLITIKPNDEIPLQDRIANRMTDGKVGDYKGNISDHPFPNSTRKNENISIKKPTISNLRTAENISFIDPPAELNEIPFDIKSFASKFYPKRNIKPNREIPKTSSDYVQSSLQFSAERDTKPNPDIFGIGNFESVSPRLSSNRKRIPSPPPMTIHRNQDMNEFNIPPRDRSPNDKISDNIDPPRKRLSGAQRRKFNKEMLRDVADPKNINQVEPDILDETEKEILAAKERVMRLDQNYNKLLNKFKDSGNERSISPKRFRRSRSTSRDRYPKEYLRVPEKRTWNKTDNKRDLYDLKIDILNRNHPVGKLSLAEKGIFDESLRQELELLKKVDYSFIPEFTTSQLIGGIYRMTAVNSKSLEWIKKNIYRFNNLWPDSDLRVKSKMSCEDYVRITVELTGYETFLEDIFRRLMRENPSIHTGLWKQLSKYSKGATEIHVLLVDPDSIQDIERLDHKIKYYNKLIDVRLTRKEKYNDHTSHGEPFEGRSKFFL